MEKLSVSVHFAALLEPVIILFCPCSTLHLTFLQSVGKKGKKMVRISRISQTSQISRYSLISQNSHTSSISPTTPTSHTTHTLSSSHSFRKTRSLFYFFSSLIGPWLMCSFWFQLVSHLPHQILGITSIRLLEKALNCDDQYLIRCSSFERTPTAAVSEACWVVCLHLKCLRWISFILWSYWRMSFPLLLIRHGPARLLCYC